MVQRFQRNSLGRMCLTFIIIVAHKIYSDPVHGEPFCMEKFIMTFTKHRINDLTLIIHFVGETKRLCSAHGAEETQ